MHTAAGLPAKGWLVKASTCVMFSSIGICFLKFSGEDALSFWYLTENVAVLTSYVRLSLSQIDGMFPGLGRILSIAQRHF